MASIDTGLQLPVPRPVAAWRMLPSRIITFCVVELMRVRHDRTELYTRAVQPILWLLIYGETFTRIAQGGPQLLPSTGK